MGSDPAPSPSLTAPGRLFAHSLARGSSQSGLYSANQTRWTSSGSGPGCHPRLPPHALRDASSPWLLGPLRSPRLQFVGAPLSPRPHVQAPMAGAAAGSRGRPQRVNMQEHMAIDVSPGPIRPIRLISDYFPHFYPFAKRALSAPDPHPAVIPAIRSAPRQRAAPEPEGDSDDSTALGALEFTLLFDADNSALHCTAHRAKGLKPPASGSVDTYVKANLLPGASKASQLRTRTVRGTRGPVWEETLTYHGFTRQDAGRKTLWLCVCEDPRLRRRRGAPPLGELRVPLRKLVPNRARSFDVCLEKRKLIKRPKSLDTARGMSLYEEAEVLAGGPTPMTKDLRLGSGSPPHGWKGHTLLPCPLVEPQVAAPAT
ncbi:double C2-like domain-containing protein gamma isoform X4 [Panthera pardus]|uniref:Double C2-like domain-containing protein gamma isoform X4 n=1 Tax=Panthera pardus TaxID=9691 RepID=A0A9W2V9M6_PANPR|nr:double C2-like domain-containing protein gamma isoform X4 [Panthera pardus]